MKATPVPAADHDEARILVSYAISPDRQTLRLRGVLDEISRDKVEWACELATERPGLPIVVDLTEVSHADDSSVQVLKEMTRWIWHRAQVAVSLTLDEGTWQVLWTDGLSREVDQAATAAAEEALVCRRLRSRRPGRARRWS